MRQSTVRPRDRNYTGTGRVREPYHGTVQPVRYGHGGQPYPRPGPQTPLGLEPLALLWLLRPQQPQPLVPPQCPNGLMALLLLGKIQMNNAPCPHHHQPAGITKLKIFYHAMSSPMELAVAMAASPQFLPFHKDPATVATLLSSVRPPLYLYHHQIHPGHRHHFGVVWLCWGRPVQLFCKVLSALQSSVDDMHSSCVIVVTCGAGDRDGIL